MRRVTERLRARRRATVSVVLVVVAGVLAGCSDAGPTSPVAWKASDGYWMRFTPADYDWQRLTIRTHCPYTLDDCTPVHNAAYEWGVESLHQFALYRTTGMTWLGEDIPYTIANFGDSGYSGLATLQDCWSWTQGRGGCRTAYGQSNTYYLNTPGRCFKGAGSDCIGSNTYYAKYAVGCQEVGHLLGLGHAATDCMGFSYWKGGTHANVDPESVEAIHLLRYLAGACTTNC